MEQTFRVRDGETLVVLSGGREVVAFHRVPGSDQVTVRSDAPVEARVLRRGPKTRRVSRP